MRSSALSAMVLLPALACAPVATSNAPVPRGADKPAYYYPTRVGTKWVYNETRNGASQEGFAQVVTASEEKGNWYLVTVKSTSVDWIDRDDTTIKQMKVAKDGVYTVADFLEREEGPVKFDPPLCDLKLPFKAGEKWRTNERDKTAPVGESVKVETVKVPAGTFEAIRVQFREQDGKVNTSWYAPGVGEVKWVRGDFKKEMKSFTVPKD